MPKEKPINRYEVTVIRTIRTEGVVRVRGPGMTPKEAKQAAVFEAQETGLLSIDDMEDNSEITAHKPMRIKEEDDDESE